MNPKANLAPVDVGFAVKPGSAAPEENSNADTDGSHLHDVQAQLRKERLAKANDAISHNSINKLHKDPKKFTQVTVFGDNSHG